MGNLIIILKKLDYAPERNISYFLIMVVLSWFHCVSNRKSPRTNLFLLCQSLISRTAGLVAVIHVVIFGTQQSEKVILSRGKAAVVSEADKISVLCNGPEQALPRHSWDDGFNSL